jgi:hypothetical protein
MRSEFMNSFSLSLALLFLSTLQHGVGVEGNEKLRGEFLDKHDLVHGELLDHGVEVVLGDHGLRVGVALVETC